MKEVEEEEEEKKEDNITGLQNLNEIILSLLKKRKNTDDVRRV